MPEDNYVCTLSPEIAQIAKIELRETELRKTQAIAQLREIIKMHPQIKRVQTGEKKNI